jgi:hypothetical protein
MNDDCARLKKWFKGNKFPLNFDKTDFMKCFRNNKTCINLNIGYDTKTKK